MDRYLEETKMPKPVISAMHSVAQRHFLTAPMLIVIYLTARLRYSRTMRKIKPNRGRYFFCDGSDWRQPCRILFDISSLPRALSKECRPQRQPGCQHAVKLDPQGPVSRTDSWIPIQAFRIAVPNIAQTSLGQRPIPLTRNCDAIVQMPLGMETKKRNPTSWRIDR